jgi:ABC transporter substrate binding protein
VTGSALTAIHRDHIIALAARYKLPAVYYEDFYVAAGGLISYGPDNVDQFRRPAGYVDRILKGEKPADLPVQAPTKYELMVNLKTAKALGLDIPPTAGPRRRGDRISTDFAALRFVAIGRFCCKSLFALVIKNSPGCRRDFRVKMWGTSSPDDKLTGDLGNAIETT